MKHVLITGVNSYVGNSLSEWLSKDPDSYSVDKISLKDGTWRDMDFSKYDSVVHVAGIAHRKETKENKALYYTVNRDLANEVAQKSRAENVQQFIFFSSMSVYGLIEGIIDEDSPLNPKTHYGISKMQAEDKINKLASDSFKVAIIRPPMIYGKGCKGNYRKLASLALKTPIFPNVNNKRSMIYIDNLCEFIRVLIQKPTEGIFCPQNKEYVNTSELVEMIAKVHGRKIKFTKLFNPIINLVHSDTITKLFGNLVYEESLTNYKTQNFIDLETSVRITEE